PPVGRDRVASVYMGGAGLMAALGVHVVEGRRLLAAEEEVMDPDARHDTTLPAVITRALAEDLYPGQSALGQPVKGL
ncbi:ABC transporter permease, partial [Salmonella enterica]|uniref:ABC transporter permease n=1 Tax=Salmonella enterica TaxID=28901 RepID=UPI00329A74D6